MDLTGLTPAAVLTVGGASVVISIIVGVIIKATALSGGAKDRFGPLLAMVVSLVVVIGFGVLQGNTDYATLLLTGILAGPASMGVHDLIGLAPVTIDPKI